VRHVAFIAKNHTNPAYGGALFGARAVAERFGYEVRHSAPEKPDDIAQQAVLVEQAIDAQPAAILLIAAHESKLTPAIRAINRARIPLVSLVGEPREGAWICHVGSDDVRLAREIAARALQRLAPGAEVAIMDGHPDSITTPKRHRGFLEALAQFPQLRLAESVAGNFQSAPARQAALGLLARHPRLAALLVANDLMAMGVLQALEETGRQLPMVSVNGTPDAVAAIRGGRLLASASFNTLAFGCLAMEAAARYLRGQPVPRRIVLPADIIDGTNCAAWDRPYEARERPDWDATVAVHGQWNTQKEDA
jgi:ribose transport system substrate-binding protein